MPITPSEAAHLPTGNELNDSARNPVVEFLQEEMRWRNVGLTTASSDLAVSVNPKQLSSESPAPGESAPGLYRLATIYQPHLHLLKLGLNGTSISEIIKAKYGTRALRKAATTELIRVCAGSQ